MPAVTQPRLHHLALTVTDLDASVSWYEAVFDVHPVLDVPHPGGVGKVLADTARQLMIALHRHETNDARLFTEMTTGLATPASPCRPEPTWKCGRTTWKPTAS